MCHYMQNRFQNILRPVFASAEAPYAYSVVPAQNARQETKVSQFRASALSAFHYRFCSRCDITIPHLPRFRVPEAESALDTNRVSPSATVCWTSETRISSCRCLLYDNGEAENA